MISNKDQSALDKMFAQLAKSARIDVFKNSLESMKAAKVVSEEIHAAQAKASQKNNLAQEKILTQFQNNLNAQLKESTVALVKAQKKVQRAVRLGNEAEMKVAMAEAQRLDGVVKNIMERARQGAKELDDYNKALEKSNDVYMADLRDRREKVEELGKVGYYAQEVMLGAIQKSSDALVEGVSSLESVSKSVFAKITTMLHKRAGALDVRASKEGDESKAKGLMQMATTMSSMAKTIAVVGGGITLLVGLFSQAEGAVKEMNRSLLQGVSYTDLMAVSGGDVQDKLETLRKSFSDGSFLDGLGISREDAVDLANSLNQANLGIRALGGGGKGLDQMRKSMTELKAQSLSMGISMDEAVSRAESFAYQIGVSVKDGAFLSTMAQDFADIRDMAVQTGYSTANFYAKVKDLTDQLDNMNLRTKEAGALFIRLSRIVGPDGVSGLLSGTASLKGEDYLDQIKRQMLTDRKKTASILEAEAQRSAMNLLGTFEANAKGMEMLSKAGLDTTSTQSMVASMQRMTTDQRQALLGELAMSQDTAGLGVELAKAFDVARGAASGASRTDRSRAFDAMGSGAGLAMQYARLETHLGGRNISDLSDIQKKAMMAFTDLTKEQLEQFGRMQDSFKGQFKMAQDLTSKGSLTEKEKEMLTSMGLKMEGGKLLTKDTDVEVTDISGFILAQSETLNESNEIQLTQEELLSQNVVATVSLADRINKYLGEILMDISSGIMDIVNFFTGKGESSATKENKAKLQKDLSSQLENLRKSSMEESKEISEIERKLKVEKDEGKRAELEKELAEATERSARIEEGMSFIKEQKQRLRTTTFGDGDLSVEQLNQKSSLSAMMAESINPQDFQTEAAKTAVAKFNEEFGTQYENLSQVMHSEQGKSGKGRHFLFDKEEEGGLGLDHGGGLFSYLFGSADTFEDELQYKVGKGSKSTHDFTKYLKDLTDSSQQRKEAVDEEKAKVKDSTIVRAQEKQNTHLAEEIVNAQKRDKLRALASSLGVNYGAEMSSTGLAEKINKRGFSTEKLMGYGYGEAALRELGIKVENIKDGLFTGGKMYRFDRMDDILAMKPGGAVDQLKSTGNVINATINVNGATDPEMVGKIVLREIEGLNRRVRGGAK
jgi:hypothetical protein